MKNTKRAAPGFGERLRIIPGLTKCTWKIRTATFCALAQSPGPTCPLLIQTSNARAAIEQLAGPGARVLVVVIAATGEFDRERTGRMPVRSRSPYRLASHPEAE